MITWILSFRGPPPWWNHIVEAVRSCADERALAVSEPSEWEQQERGVSQDRYRSLTGRAGELRFHVFMREEGGPGRGAYARETRAQIEGERLQPAERRALWKSLETALRQVGLSIDLDAYQFQHIIDTLRTGGEDGHADELLREHPSVPPWKR